MLSFLYLDNPSINKTPKVESSHLPLFLPTSPVVSNLVIIFMFNFDQLDSGSTSLFCTDESLIVIGESWSMVIIT